MVIFILGMKMVGFHAFFHDHETHHAHCNHDHHHDHASHEDEKDDDSDCALCDFVFIELKQSYTNNFTQSSFVSVVNTVVDYQEIISKQDDSLILDFYYTALFSRPPPFKHI